MRSSRGVEPKHGVRSGARANPFAPPSAEVHQHLRLIFPSTLSAQASASGRYLRLSVSSAILFGDHFEPKEEILCACFVLPTGTSRAAVVSSASDLSAGSAFASDFRRFGPVYGQPYNPSLQRTHFVRR